MTPRRLDSTCELSVKPTRPFNFAGTVWKKSHFPSPVESFEKGVLRFTMRLNRTALGVRVSQARSQDVRAKVYSARPLSDCEQGAVEKELRWRFDLDADLDSFLSLASRDELLRGVVSRWKGMRVKCCQSLYELLVIAIVLQNATVRRSVQMFENLLRAYGTPVGFDGNMLYCLWLPKKLANAGDADLRALHVGYRSTHLIRQAVQFSQEDWQDVELRRLDQSALHRRLLSIYGVGPATAWIIEFEAFHCYDALDHISPWETKIYGQLLFGRDQVSVEEILHRIDGWRPWRMLAIHYLFEDLFWRHGETPIPWLQTLIRL